MNSSSISVAVRVRPFSEKERNQVASSSNTGPTLFSSEPSSSSSSGITPQPARLTTTGGGGIRKVLKVLDERILVFDPPETNAVHAFNQQQPQRPPMGKKVKDIRFCFDRVFDEQCGQEEVYDGSAKDLVSHVMNGFNSTVFAYGATGCGKTHTISGSQSQPGIVFLIMKDLFSRISDRSSDTDFSLTVSYLEVYNETIRDLLAPEMGPLALRESNGNASATGLSTKEPTCATDVVEWITFGNQNRTVNATEANATSSRSHAVLTVTVSQRAKAGGMTDSHSTACLSVIDLAGSERASVTKNKGERLLEGANINRSLLALGNCINALCDPKRRGHVPYRDSKLTRLLKQSLGGNCRTVMIVCVSPSSAHYDETHNTLQYANRAKEIKTKAVRNVINVDRHVAQYCQQIMEQSQQIELLRKQLADRSAGDGARDREEDSRAVQQAKQRIMPAWEEAKDKLVRSESARIERNAIQAVIQTLEQWKSAAFLGVDVANDSVASAILAGWQKQVSSLSNVSTRLAQEAQLGEDALDAYNAMYNTTSASLKTSRPGAVCLFALESKVLESRLDAAMAEAREAGIAEGMKVQAKAMSSMFEARIKVSSNDSSRTLADNIDTANRTALLAFTSRSHQTGGVKRDQGARSPFEVQNPWTKTARTAANGFGSTPSGVLASPIVRPITTFVKQSPRKGVVFPSSSGSALRTSPRKRKEVQWRDEAGDGGLEDVKFSTPDSIDSTPASSANPKVIVEGPADAASPIVAASVVGNAADQMSARLRQKSIAPPIRSRATTRMISPLATVTEGGGGSPFSFLKHDPARSPLGDVGNTSTSSNGSASGSTSTFSMAGPSGLFAPLVPRNGGGGSLEPDTPRRAARAGRRISSIGPQRSHKVNRRTSAVSPAVVGGSVRRVGVLSSGFAPPIRMSPRKVALGIGATMGSRRTSVAPPNATTFKSAAAARIAARRESAMAAVAGASGGASTSSGVGRRESPTSGSTGPVKPWR